MPATRQFLVTIPFWIEGAPPSACATVLRDDLKRLYNGPEGRDADITVVPLPDLNADDSALQIGFRRLASLKTHPHVAEMVVSRDEALALVAELSKEKPGRTNDVELAALDAMRAIRESDARSGRQVQKDARVQLIITDAICRCVSDVVD